MKQESTRQRLQGNYIVQITFFQCLGAQVSLKARTIVEKATLIKTLQALLFETYSKALPLFCPRPSPPLFGRSAVHSALPLDAPSIPPCPDLGSEAPWTASEAPWLPAGLGQWGHRRLGGGGERGCTPVPWHCPGISGCGGHGSQPGLPFTAPAFVGPSLQA